MKIFGDRRATSLACLLGCAALSCNADRRVVDMGAQTPRDPARSASPPPSAADEDPALSGFGSSPNNAATFAPARSRRPVPVVPVHPTPTSPEPAPETPKVIPPVAVPSVSPPILLGTLAGPDMPRTQPDLKMYGTDLGLSFKHDGKLVMLFGDTWPSSEHICEGQQIVNDDTVAYLPLEYRGGIPELRYLTRTDSPNELRYIKVFRGTESLQLGYGQAPVAGFSDGKRNTLMYRSSFGESVRVR
ncbi:MAG TPA: hypothetical protein VFG30_24470 [Polyangiales bacterium]|nr:hypothetical protein [Polyangiales bacterium]